jgi:oligo-alginate lyase
MEVSVLRSLLFGLLLTASAGAAENFPKPDPARAFPELKEYDAAGRPWRAAREDWNIARQLVKTDPAWTAWLRGERSAIDRWMTRHRDRVEWRCGWWHDFVSPKDGSHLVWTEEVPGEGVAFLRSDSDPRVEITPKIFGGWVFSFRGTHASIMQRAARLYRLQGDERYAAWTAAQLDFYAAHYPEWAENRDGARLYWQTLDVATNLVQYATAVRLLGDYAAPERRARWLQAFFRPQVDVLHRTRQDIHNIATWHRCAEMQVALVFQDDAMWRAALDGDFGLRQQIARGITSDYLWYEQSFGYNSYVVRAVLTLFNTAGIYGRANELSTEMAVTENLMLSPIYLRFPDGHAPNPADNASAPLRVPDLATLGAAYRVFPTSLGRSAAAAARTWEALLDPVAPGAAGGPPSLPAVVSRNLESSRMAVLRAEGWQVYFHYGQLTRSHAQAEALNFAAFYGNKDITHDPGTVGYGSPLHREYYTRGLSHNVPLVNGEGEEPAQRGELLTYSATPARVDARQPAYRKNADASRVLAIIDGALVDTATVTAKAGPERLGLALHLQGRVRLPAAFGLDPGFAAKRPPAFGYWRDVTRATFRDRAELEVECSGQRMLVTFEAPGDFTLWHGSAPDQSPRRREAFYLELKDRAPSATFKTTLKPQP